MKSNNIAVTTNITNDPSREVLTLQWSTTESDRIDNKYKISLDVILLLENDN